MGNDHPKTKVCPSCLGEKEVHRSLCKKCRVDCPVCHGQKKVHLVLCKKCMEECKKWDHEHGGEKWPDDFIRMKKGHPERTKADECSDSDSDSKEEKPPLKRSKIEVLESIDDKLQKLIDLQTSESEKH
jgi:hypothetical protein